MAGGEHSEFVIRANEVLGNWEMREACMSAKSRQDELEF
jgi:hypothetical protein